MTSQEYLKAIYDETLFAAKLCEIAQAWMAELARLGVPNTDAGTEAGLRRILATPTSLDKIPEVYLRLALLGILNAYLQKYILTLIKEPADPSWFNHAAVEMVTGITLSTLPGYQTVFASVQLQEYMRFGNGILPDLIGGSSPMTLVRLGEDFNSFGKAFVMEMEKTK